MIEERERFADPVDAGCAAAETWIADKIAEQRRQMAVTNQSFEDGRCRNCLDKTDDGRNYCDDECRNDHQSRVASDKRNGKYRGV